MNLRKLKNQAGFTLVELIVVIAIMAILAGVAVPVYSGYIEKANKAADLQLLGAVNSAFGAAVIENGAVPQELSSASAPISGGKVTSVSASGVDSAALNASFTRYFAGNETAEFKVITTLYYNAKDGVFVDDPEKALNDAQKAVLNYLKDTYGAEGAEVDQYLESTFNSMGSETLMGQVDWVADFAASSILAEGDLFGLVMSDSYLQNLATYMKTDVDTLKADMEAMVAEDPQKWADFMGNSLVLSVANNAATNPALTKDAVTALLTGGSTAASKNITTNMGTAGQEEVGLAQAAMVYGMYTSYANSLPDDYNNNGVTKQDMINKAANISSVGDLTDMLDTLDSAGFQSYMAEGGQGEKDLEGYLAALKMVETGSKENKDVTNDVLNNGFGSLSGILDSLNK